VLVTGVTGEVCRVNLRSGDESILDVSGLAGRPARLPREGVAMRWSSLDPAFAVGGGRIWGPELVAGAATPAQPRGNDEGYGVGRGGR
jgi:hypothetical protein